MIKKSLFMVACSLFVASSAHAVGVTLTTDAVLDARSKLDVLHNVAAATGINLAARGAAHVMCNQFHQSPKAGAATDLAITAALTVAAGYKYQLDPLFFGGSLITGKVALYGYFCPISDKTSRALAAASAKDNNGDGPGAGAPSSAGPNGD